VFLNVGMMKLYCTVLYNDLAFILLESRQSRTGSTGSPSCVARDTRTFLSLVEYSGQSSRSVESYRQHEGEVFRRSPCWWTRHLVAESGI